jgi:hypothetical protein
MGRPAAAGRVAEFPCSLSISLSVVCRRDKIGVVPGTLGLLGLYPIDGEVAVLLL